VVHIEVVLANAKVEGDYIFYLLPRPDSEGALFSYDYNMIFQEPLPLLHLFRSAHILEGKAWAKSGIAWVIDSRSPDFHECESWLMDVDSPALQARTT
jgi:hypothetical protein